MRVSRQQAAQNRRNILTTASRLFRERGIGATGVDAITEEAGLTHGAIYSRFGSKEEIAAQAIGDALESSAKLWRRMIEREGRDQAFSLIVDAYLSPAHRDRPGQGCVVAALGGELARQSAAVRQAFTNQLKEALGVLAGAIPRRASSRVYDDAIAAFVAMAGALIIARAVGDERFSTRILNATAARVRVLASGRASPTRTRRKARSGTAGSPPRRGRSVATGADRAAAGRGAIKDKEEDQ